MRLFAALILIILALLAVLWLTAPHDLAGCFVYGGQRFPSVREANREGCPPVGLR